MPLVYDELRRIAARYISRERPGQTRVGSCRSRMVIYARAFGICGWTTATRYFFLGDTGWVALLRRPSVLALRYIFNGYYGKFLGLWWHANHE